MIPRLFTVLCFATLSAFSGLAQTTELPPTGPLIQTQTPAVSAWQIEYRYEEKAQKEDPQKNPLSAMIATDPAVAALLKDNPRLAAQMNPPRVTLVRIIRTGVTRHEEIAYDNGTTDETWLSGDYRMSRSAGSPKIQVVSGARAGGSEFPEFSWITRENFTATRKVNGRDCLAFEMELDPLQIEDPGLYQILLERQRHAPKTKKPQDTPADSAPTTLSGRSARAVAVIDAETKLPVALQMGKTSRLYQFQPAPTQLLTLPPEWAQAAQEHEVAHRKLTKRLSPP